jgi:hypothetical protein
LISFLKEPVLLNALRLVAFISLWKRFTKPLKKAKLFSLKAKLFSLKAKLFSLKAKPLEGFRSFWYFKKIKKKFKKSLAFF